MQKMNMSGDTDKDFAMMMKIYHQGAVDMAEMELGNADDARRGQTWPAHAGSNRRWMFLAGFGRGRFTVLAV